MYNKSFWSYILNTKKKNNNQTIVMNEINKNSL